MKNRSDLVWGIILIVIGACLLVTRVFPNTFNFLDWPFSIIAVGVVFLLAAILSRNGGLAIPGCIVGGIGAILYYQEMTGMWDTWAYAWTLIPGFVGIGILLSGLIDRSGPKFESSSLVLLAISAAGFIIFGGTFGLGWSVGAYWPLFIIGLGVIVLISAFIKPKKKE
ncbi:MAG: hypothetical protein ACYC59_11850 [Anaerolineaceae bacterium]